MAKPLGPYGPEFEIPGSWHFNNGAKSFVDDVLLNHVGLIKNESHTLSDLHSEEAIEIVKKRRYKEFC